jgi:DnaJ-class molecular chaperone
MNEDNYITFGQDMSWPFGFVKPEEKKPCCRCDGHGADTDPPHDKCWMCDGTGKDLT